MSLQPTLNDDGRVHRRDRVYSFVLFPFSGVLEPKTGSETLFHVQPASLRVNIAAMKLFKTFNRFVEVMLRIVVMFLIMTMNGYVRRW
jgi:hypothetical protein